MRVDLLVKTKHMLTMQGDGVGYRENHALAITDGVIIDVLEIRKAEEIYEAYETHNFEHHVILPGLIDAHMHSSNAIFRGMAQDTANWMMEGYMPLVKHMSKKAGKVGSKLAIAEGIKNGTTCFSDFDYPIDDILDLVEDSGVRALVSPRIRSVPNQSFAPGELYSFDEEQGEHSFKEAMSLALTWHNKHDGRIRMALGPQGVDFVHEELLQQIFSEAKTHGLKVHMHLQQGDRETEQVMLRHNKRPIAYLDDLGLLDERLIAVHLTDAQEEEAKLVAKRGASMIFCPGSIAIIDGLVPPALAFLEGGGVVGLGSDQASGNNCHNMFNEMKLAALLCKVRESDPEVLPAYQALRMATIEGAKALGFDDLIGSLEKGKRADFICVNLDSLTMQPVITEPLRNIVPNLVYSARGNEVSHAYVEGKHLLREGSLTTISERDLLEDIKDVSRGLMQDILEKESDLKGRQYDLMKEDKL